MEEVRTVTGICSVWTGSLEGKGTRVRWGAGGGVGWGVRSTLPDTVHARELYKLRSSCSF